MTGPERGFLLLCCELSDGLRPLTLAQLRRLGALVRAQARDVHSAEELTEQSLLELGCDEALAARIAALLERGEALDEYLRLARSQGIVPLTVRSPAYPKRLRSVLGEAAPPVLFLRGDPALLQKVCVAAVGSRSLTPRGCAFAERAGRLAAQEGFVLVSGNARGADQRAQLSAYLAGGSHIAFVANSLAAHIPTPERSLFVSELGWELPFSAARAHSRNRLIHALGELTLVAQTGASSGGTFSGTAENLRHGWSPVFVNDDGSPGAEALSRLGAKKLPLAQLQSVRALL